MCDLIYFSWVGDCVEQKLHSHRMSYTLAFLFFELCIEFKKFPWISRSDPRMFALKKKLSWCWLVRLLSASCFVVSNCEREGYCSNKKNLRTLSLSEKIQLWYAYTLLLRKHVVIDSYNRFSWQLWFLLKTFQNWNSVIQLGFELQVQQSGICWLIFSDIALLCAKQVSLRLSFVKPKQCLRYSRCATKQRAAAYQWLVFGWGSCKTSWGSNSTM